METLTNRVTGNEPFFNGESAMPIGMISDMMVVGNWSNEVGGLGSGAVWSFKRDGTDFVPVQKITPLNPENNMRFGWSLAVEEQVDTNEAWLAIGGPAFRFAGNTRPTGNDYFVVGAPRNTTDAQNGSIYIFEGANRVRQFRPDNVQGNDRFGTAVAFREDLEGGDHLILACSRGPDNGDSGAAYVYDQSDFNEPWLPKNAYTIARADSEPGNTSRVCQSIASWNGLLALGVPNLKPGLDAAYANPIAVFIDGFD